MDFLRRVIAKSNFYCFHLEKDITEKNLSSMTCRVDHCSSASKRIFVSTVVVRIFDWLKNEVMAIKIQGLFHQTLGIFARFDFMFKLAQLLS